jgi:hypothetical protein
MKLRNRTRQFAANGSQVVDAAARGWGADNRAARRRRSGGPKNNPLFRGEPIINRNWVEHDLEASV